MWSGLWAGLVAVGATLPAFTVGNDVGVGGGAVVDGRDGDGGGTVVDCGGDGWVRSRSNGRASTARAPLRVAGPTSKTSTRVLIGAKMACSCAVCLSSIRCIMAIISIINSDGGCGGGTARGLAGTGGRHCGRPESPQVAGSSGGNSAS